MNLPIISFKEVFANQKLRQGITTVKDHKGRDFNLAYHTGDDYLKVAPALVEAKKTFVTADKTFAAGLPSPKLKYGEKEDLKQGIISWKTSLKGEKALKDPKVSQAKAVAQTAPSSYMVEPKNPKGSITAFDKLRGDATNVEKDLFKQFMTQKKIPTPLKDEISRREYLKDKTTR